MAVSELVSRRYAEALLGVAREQSAVERQRDALERAVGLLGAPQAAAALDNPRASAQEKQRLVVAVLEGGKATPEVRNLVRLLLERGRVTALSGVLRAYDALVDRASGRLRAEVLTAVAADAGLERRISSALADRLGGEVQTTVRQDTEILGGLVIRIGDRVIDGSVRTRLSQLQAQLT